ncbi:MAG: hypothetical protein LBL41_03150 [Bifidobacteriaceae bacterium]|jgi:hypothetical protein|nr:hypothetical protein [Bifidobacteriaceae bacterium]
MEENANGGKCDRAFDPANEHLTPFDPAEENAKENANEHLTPFDPVSVANSFNRIATQ